MSPRAARVVSEAILRIEDRHSHRGDPPVSCRPLPSAAPRRRDADAKREHSALAVDQKRVEGTSGNPYDRCVTRAARRHGQVELDQYPELGPAHATTNIAMVNGAARASRPAPMRSVILPIVGSFPAVGADERFERCGSCTSGRG